MSALKTSKNSDNGTVSPPYPEMPVRYTMLGKYGDSERKMSIGKIKFDVGSNQRALNGTHAPRVPILPGVCVQGRHSVPYLA